MTSDHATERTPDLAYVWVWLPGATEPVVAGRLDAAGSSRRPSDRSYTFTYGRSYLQRPGAIALYLPELPLQTGRLRPPRGLSAPGCIRDAAPDAWGQRVILARQAARAGGRSRARLSPEADTADLDLLTYLLASDSDRIGGMDFQSSPTTYLPRTAPHATLEQLQSAAALLEAGQPLPDDLAEALQHGTSIGGARPKAILDPSDAGSAAPGATSHRQLIAKFSSSSDPYPVVKAEGIAMELARRVGLDAPWTQVTRTDAGRDVLLVERFDRTEVPGQRRLMVSALTIAELDEMMGRYATYHGLADTIRARFTDPRATLRELFSRIVFNVLVGNTDDHARNHAAFWDGDLLRLTPVYDVCPQLRAGTEAQQAMAIDRDGARSSQVGTCVAAAGVYQLTTVEAREIVDHQVEVIRRDWDEAADAALLTQGERDQLWERQILNPYAFYPG